MNITDTHTHLENYQHPFEVLAHAKAEGVDVIAVTFQPTDYKRLVPLYGNENGVRVALGMHPLYVTKVDLDLELDLFRRLSNGTNYIGEIGLDFSAEGITSRELQEESFDTILRTPGVSRKLLSLHSRGAQRFVIERLAEVGAERAILHWFSGSVQEAGDGVEAGFYFSINSTMTETTDGREIIAAIPPDRVLVESDGPRARYTGHEIEPAHVWSAIDYLADQWEVPRNRVADQLASNLRRLLADL